MKAEHIQLFMTAMTKVETQKKEIGKVLLILRQLNNEDKRIVLSFMDKSSEITEILYTILKETE